MTRKPRPRPLRQLKCAAISGERATVLRRTAPAPMSGENIHQRLSLLRPLAPLWRMTRSQTTLGRLARSSFWWTKQHKRGCWKSRLATVISLTQTNGINTWPRGSQRSALYPGAHIEKHAKDLANTIIRPSQHYKNLWGSANPAELRCNLTCRSCWRNARDSFGVCCAPARPKNKRCLWQPLLSTTSLFSMTPRSRQISTPPFAIRPSNTSRRLNLVQFCH